MLPWEFERCVNSPWYAILLAERILESEEIKAAREEAEREAGRR